MAAPQRSSSGASSPDPEIIRRATEARELGATEICVQAGLAPGIDGRHYVDLCRTLKETLPTLHIHGFSPEEILQVRHSEKHPVTHMVFIFSKNKKECEKEMFTIKEDGRYTDSFISLLGEFYQKL